MISITIPGTPIAKKRPRFARIRTKTGKEFVNTYDSQETEAGRFFLLAKQQINQEPMKTALTLFCAFLMPIPKGTSQKKHDSMLKHEIRHTKKPDLSNLIKFVEDCLNGLAWIDDSQIVSLKAVKHFSDEPRTEVIINPL